MVFSDVFDDNVLTLLDVFVDVFATCLMLDVHLGLRTWRLACFHLKIYQFGDHW